MAHFAKISDDNIVLQVLTLDNSVILNSSNVEEESKGQQYLEVTMQVLVLNGTLLIIFFGLKNHMHRGLKILQLLFGIHQ